MSVNRRREASVQLTVLETRWLALDAPLSPSNSLLTFLLPSRPLRHLDQQLMRYSLLSQLLLPSFCFLFFLCLCRCC
jgi:predicted nuclease with RNAse H fold